MAKPHDTLFKVLRIYVFINSAIMYALVFFHRTCPSIVSEDMADDYGVKKKKLGIFSSVFFYPYAVMQVFAGLLADVLEPAILIGGAQIIAAIGSVICGASNNVAVGSVGRFFVGLGCGPSYVPICKVAANWFDLKYYSHLLGVVLAIGGVGGIIAQFPLASFADKYGWRVAFYGIGGLGFVLSVLVILFCRGTPESRGYEPVNPQVEKEKDETLKEKLTKLKNNFIVVVQNKYFWICAPYIFLKDGPFFDVNGLWAGPFLSDVYGHSSSKKGITLVGFSIGMIVGSFAYPPISQLLKTRKWLMTGSSALACVIFIVMSIEGGDVPYGLLYVFFIFIGITLNAVTCLIFSLVREYYDPAIAGTSIGLANFFAFFASAIFQTISSEVIPNAGSYQKEGKDEDIYLEEGYRNGLWIICAAATGVGAIIISFTKDTMGEKKPEAIEEEKKSEAKDLKDNEDINSSTKRVQVIGKTPEDQGNNNNNEPEKASANDKEGEVLQVKE